MLEKVHIKNYRSCADVEVTFESEVTALLGKNGVGKTNILHAIKVAAMLCVGGTDRSFRLDRFDESKPSEFTLWFRLADLVGHYRVRAISAPSGHGELYDEEGLELNGRVIAGRSGERLVLGSDGERDFRVGSGVGMIPFLLSVLPGEDLLLPGLQELNSAMGAYHYYALPQHEGSVDRHDTHDIVSEEEYRIWKADHGAISSERAAGFRLVDLWLRSPEDFQEMKHLLGDGGLGVVSEIVVERLQLGNGVQLGDFVLSFTPSREESHRKFSVGLGGLSTGTRRVLSMLTILFHDKASCMLLEQPEDSVHPGLLAKIVGILQAYSMRTQVICTTHSAALIDELPQSAIRLVSHSDGSTAVRGLTASDHEAVSRYLAEEGSLADFIELLQE